MGGFVPKVKPGRDVVLIERGVRPGLQELRFATCCPQRQRRHFCSPSREDVSLPARAAWIEMIVSLVQSPIFLGRAEVKREL